MSPLAPPWRVTGLLFASLWLWIGLSSSWDLFLAVQFRHQLVEYNPEALLLLEHGGLAALALAKMGGTVLALGLLQLLWLYRHGSALAVAFVVALFQAGLLLFQHLAY